MSIHRHAARSDENQPQIIEALRNAGAKVYHIRQPLDLLVAFRGKFYVMEVKTPTGTLSPSQKDVIQEMAYAGCWPNLVRSPEDALRAIGAMDKK